jgi:L-threonate 2-dehydrogenase
MRKLLGKDRCLIYHVRPGCAKLPFGNEYARQISIIDNVASGCMIYQKEERGGRGDDGRPDREEPVSIECGFVGLGVLGSAIARNIVAAGRPVLGYDVAEAARRAAAADGVTIAESVGAVAAAVPILFTCLPNADALRDVAAEIVATAREGQIVVELSTLAVADKEAARDLLEAHGRRALDCPVSGNRIMALQKGLTAFCSGDRDAYEAVREALLAFCKKEHYVGAFGNGSKTKFCGNILNLVHNAVAAEAMVLAMKSGLDPRTFHEAISGSGSSSAMFEVRGKLMAENDYAREGMNFSVPLKDSRIIAEHAASVASPIPLYQAAVQFYHAAAAQGMAHLDAAAVCRVMERLANCERPE